MTMYGFPPVGWDEGLDLDQKELAPFLWPESRTCSLGPGTRFQVSCSLSLSRLPRQHHGPIPCAESQRTAPVGAWAAARRRGPGSGVGAHPGEYRGCSEDRRELLPLQTTALLPKEAVQAP